MPDWTAAQIGIALDELYQEYGPHFDRMRVRRLLLEMSADAKDDDRTGTYLPSPYDNSKLMLKTLIGDVQDVVQNYTARVSANEPQTKVIPVALNRSKIGKRVEQNAAEQERLLMSQWEAVKGRQAQRQAAWSQSWGRVGWYLTLPRDATWGLPDRKYFEDLSDAETAAMRRAGSIVPTGDGKFKESAETWLGRRRLAGQENAVSGRSLFTLEEYGPDMVLPRYDRDGTAARSLKYAFVVEEVPTSAFAVGSEMAKAAAKFAGKSKEDAEKYGLFVDKAGDLVGGVTAGAEPGAHKGKTWTLARFLTRNEVYYYVTETPRSSGGVIIWHEEHGAGQVPLIPVPGMYTDSSTPGGEFTSLMESVFALTPLINQIETLFSNVATWNALGRWVIEREDGTFEQDDDGEVTVLSSEDMVGRHAGQTDVVNGKVRQLRIEAGDLFQLLDFYTARLDRSKPSPVTEGQASASAAAWQVRQLLESSGELLEQAVSNHAEAVKQVQLLWVRWMRMLDEPIYAFAAPGFRSSNKAVRGLIEFDPADLVTSIRVEQSPQSAQQLVVLRQSGIELLQAGRIDEKEYYENYDLSADPEESIVRAWAQRATDLVMLGSSVDVDPTSVLAQIVSQAAQRNELEMIDRSPGFALATAQRMASTAAQAAAGNVAVPEQIRQPGLGMGSNQAGSPDDQAPPAA